MAKVFDLPQEQVFRLAGILPEKPQSNVVLEEIKDLLSLLDIEEKNLVQDFLRMLIERKK